MHLSTLNFIPSFPFLFSFILVVSCLGSENDYHSEKHFSERDRTFFDVLMDDYRKMFNGDTMVCHDICENPLRYANTYTPYSVIANLTTAPYEFEGCHPVKLWLLIRHGSRTMDSNTRQASSKILPRIRHHILYSHMIGKGDLDEQTVELFKNWTENLPLDNQKSLTMIGEEEMYNLAVRTRERHPHFFKSNYSELQHEFRSSIKQRTKDSAIHFARGLFPDELYKVRFESSKKDDQILRFHTRCRQWVKSVERNSSTYHQLDEFLSSPTMAEALIRISYRLGLNYTLDYSEAKLMLRYCASQSAWDGHDSPWCHVFSDQELKIIDHADDIRRYYLHSYPHEINYKQACPLVRAMLKFLGTNPEDGFKSRFLFSHSGSMLKFITAMGLFEEKSNLSEHNWQNKTWRGSFIDAFASNYAAILYKCSDNVDKVLTLYQEQPMILRNCDSILCPLAVIQDTYKAYMDCNFDKICRNRKRKND
ncbi:multiple inositol polyphosphate phosphatase 1 isoform X2 [Nilaparvata lugens]|uniref:multiple inositol polyphosphate phosphatase 1 isoform X2 n=1 Tax=Nilaparvata lugens TaxID=108931 RepID=UPI00193DF54F|nr:multiple inositol polyphosphate phosphatase 1 isoform X2 [Nilaparvata lugens]